MMKFRTYILLCFFLSTGATSLRAQQGDIIDATEIASLRELYNATSNNGTAAWSAPWNKTKLSTAGYTFADFTISTDLPGVTIQDGDVVAIQLGNVGAIGFIPTSITALTDLAILKIDSYTPGIYQNRISGVLPNLGALVKLTTLSLSRNDCTGTVDWLGSLIKSITVNLSNNSSPKLTIIPTANFSNLVNLTTLNLENASFPSNSLTTHFQFLDKLATLDLSGCSLTATSFSAEFGGMAALTDLDLSSNPIVNIPTALSSLTTLVSLNLSSVSLQSIPSSFDNLNLLTSLNLSSNNLTNDVNFSSIISSIVGCNILATLDLSNNLLTNVSSNFSQLIALRTLNLSLNPVGFSDLSNLLSSPVSTLYLSACSLTSTVPSILTSLASLKNLYLDNIALGGAALTDPRRNNIDLNSSAVESVLKNLQFLELLHMGNHAIAGPSPLPNWFGTNEMAKLKVLFLFNNKITLPLNPNFSLMSELTRIELNYNQLDGILNLNCSSHPKLNFLDISFNQLDSPMPDFTTCGVLQMLIMNNNNFSGPLPPDFGKKLTTLAYLNISNNYFESLPVFEYLPTTPPTQRSLSLHVSNNYFDFSDLDQFYWYSNDTKLCTSKISGLSYAPQREQLDLKGDASAFYVPEGISKMLSFDFAGTANNNYYQWEYFSGGSWGVVSGFDVTEQGEDLPPIIEKNNTFLVENASPSNAGLYRTQIRNRCVSGQYTGNNVQLILVPPLCESEIPNQTGTFKLDKLTGSIVFERADCSTKIPITCVFGPSKTISNVVAASAVTHSDEWSYSYLRQSETSNPFESGEKGKWRAKASYTHSAPVVQANDKNYNAGTFSYRAFNWRSGAKSNYPGWIKVNQIEKYNPNGEPTEERNALNIPSIAKFGYHDAVPYVMAQNADYSSILFESFETEYPTGKFEDNFVKNGAVLVDASVPAHAGVTSLKLPGVVNFKLRTFSTTYQIKAQGMQVKLWVRGEADNALQLHVHYPSGSLITTVTFERIASSGEWTLYEALLVPTDFSSLQAPTSSFDLHISHSGSATIWVDDLRVQPTNAEATAYVYEKGTLRLLTVFDDQHFGLFYQYNAEGKLIRKLIETERGVKTIQETQYNSKKSALN